MNYKKLVSAALTATTVLWMVGAAALPLANAQTSTSLSAEIAALQSQIASLESQLGTSGTTTTTSANYDFTSDLTVGSTGAQVTALQAFLIAQGDLTAVSAPTGYFGALTQAALGEYQASVGISPDAGYFGPITRAYINALSSTTTTTTTTGTLPAGCTSTSGFSPTTGVSCSTGTSTVVAPSTGLQVGLDSSNPGAGSLISSSGSGSGRATVMAFDLTAGNSGAVTVTGLNFQQNGVLSQSAISGAYLVQNGQVVAQYNSLNNGLLSFSGLSLSIPAGQTETFDLAINIAGGLSAGNTTSFSLPNASDVTAWNSDNSAITPTGNFPINGNTFTVTTVSNPSLATLTITSSSIGNSVTAGTQGNIVGSWNFTVANSPVWLQNVNFHVIGSANVANIQNVKLLVNGVQVGTTLPSVPANGMADFNTTSTSVELGTGTNNVQVVADVMGSPSDNFQFEILNSYDVLAVDSQYNVPISVTNTSGVGTQVNIATGSITLDQDANTPTGNIAKGTSGVVLAKYDLYAAGEPVKVQFLDFNIGFTGAPIGGTLSSQIQNVSLVDDAGDQVGTTINQPPLYTSCANTVPSSGLSVTGAGNATFTSSAATYADCFGSSGSPINYIVPANTTRVLSLKADVENGATFSTITANLSGNTDNLQGQTSDQLSSTSGVNGVALTLVSSSLTATQNNALGTQNVSAGQTGLRIGSFALSASSAGGVNVNTVSVQLGNSTPTNINAFQNLKLLVNGTQFGTTQGVVTNGGTYSFSGAAFNVPAGSTVNLDVYADTLSSASGTFNSAVTLTGFTGVGQTSYSSISLTTGSVPGQELIFNGQPALTIAADSSNPPSGQIVQNSTGNTLAVYRFTETSNVENVKVTQLNVLDVVSSTSAKAAFSNVSLWNGSTELGTAQSPTYNGTNGYNYDFTSFLNPLVVPQGNSVSLTLKGDAGSFTNGSITDGSTQTFTIASGTTSGGVNTIPATSTIAVSIPSPLSTATSYAYDVTANGVVSPYTSETLTATTTVGQEAQIAGYIAAIANANYAALGLSNNGASSNGANVTFTSATGGSNINPSASIFTVGQVTSVTGQYVGVAGTAGTGVPAVTALGATSNKNASVSLTNASGNSQTVLRSTLAVAATPVTSLPPAGIQPIGAITLTANAAGDDQVTNLKLTFNGTASSTAFLDTVKLKDPSGNDVVLVDNYASSSVAGSGTATPSVTWSFTTPVVITAGSSYTLTLWADLSQIPSITSQSQSLTATINGTGDFTYQDGTTQTPLSINLTPNQVPITVVSLTTPQGGQF